MLVELVAPITNAMHQLQTNINLQTIAKSNTAKNEQKSSEQASTTYEKMKYQSSNLLATGIQEQQMASSVNSMAGIRPRGFDLTKPYVPVAEDQELLNNIEYLQF